MKLFTSVLLMSLLSIPALAKGTMSFFKNGSGKNEIDINLSVGAIKSYKTGDKSNTDIDFFGSYSYLIQPKLQILVEAGISSWPDGADRKNLLTAMGGVTFNLDSELDESIFFQGAAGLRPAYVKNDGKYESKLSFFGGVGKRFSIFDHVSLKPLARLEKNGDMDMSILIMPLNFSLLF